MKSMILRAKICQSEALICMSSDRNSTLSKFYACTLIALHSVRFRTSAEFFHIYFFFKHFLHLFPIFERGLQLGCLCRGFAGGLPEVCWRFAGGLGCILYMEGIVADGSRVKRNFRHKVEPPHWPFLLLTPLRPDGLLIWFQN